MPTRARRLRRRARRLRRGRRPGRAFGDVARTLARQLPRRSSRRSPPATPAAGVVPIENLINGTVRENYDLLLEHDLADRRRGRRPGPAVPRRAAGPAHRRDRAGLLAHPGARPGRGVPARPAVAAADDLQHGRRRQVHRRPGERGPRPSCRRGRPALFGLEVLADEIGDLPGQPHALRGARPAAASRRRGRRTPASPAGPRWSFAVRNEPGDRCSPCSASSPRTGST